MEALRLYEPLPNQVAFHASNARIRLVRSGHRGGKSTVAAAEVSRAVTGQDPYNKYPKTDGKLYVVAHTFKELGRVIWPKLSKPGAIPMIRDLQSGEWRAFRPWSAEDAKRRAETRRAPALIPPRFIKSISWLDKSEGQPSLVKLHNGWELSFFSSEGLPPMGDAIDLWWVDEEPFKEVWIPELSARVVDRSGRGIISATMLAGSQYVYEIHEKAEEDFGKPNPMYEEFELSLLDNPFLTDEDKEFLVRTYSEEDYAVRIEGKFKVEQAMVYPEYGNAHRVPYREIPRHWSRYVAVDPGVQVCAVLFAAVPPPDEGDDLYIYDELYLRNCTAEMFGEQMAMKAVGQSFQAFIIDYHGSIRTEVIGKTIQQQFMEALTKHKVESDLTGSGFIYSTSDVVSLKAGVMAVHGYMRVREDGTPKLRVLENSVPSFEWEIKRYRNKVDPKTKAPTDMPDQKRNQHLMDCCRYLCVLNPTYVKPKPKRKETGVLEAYKKKLRKQKQESGGSFVNMGPAA